MCFQKLFHFIETIFSFLPNIPMTDCSAVTMNKEGTASHLEYNGVETITVIVDYLATQLER
jgi:hypothetical protein